MPTTKLPPRITAILAATAAAGVSGAAIAGAASTSSSSSGTATTQQQQRPQRPDETPLTGETKSKVEAAALDKVPGGTIVRTETDSEGVYEAHVRKSDGSEVIVQVNKDFEVTAVQAAPAGGRGHGGPGGRGDHGREDLTAIAKTLGVSATDLQKAVDAARPDKGRDGGHGDLAARLAAKLGESTSDVQAVLDANHPDRSAGRPAPGSKPDESKLAKALASKFGISQEKAQAALDAVRPDRTAFYAAVATSLGKTVSEVQKAFEANRPVAPPQP